MMLRRVFADAFCKVEFYVRFFVMPLHMFVVAAIDMLLSLPFA